jgi:PHP family Zn ribbon phosphoesterase
MAVLGVDSPSVQKVWNIYDSLTTRFGTELEVLTEASRDEMVKVVDENVADAVINVRSGQVRVAPGYDGVYGKLMLSPNDVTEGILPKRVLQSNLHDFL